VGRREGGSLSPFGKVGFAAGGWNPTMKKIDKSIEEEKTQDLLLEALGEGGGVVG